MFKLPSVLALLGGVWMLFLYFNSADVTYYGPDQSDDRVKVACEPLGRWTGAAESLDGPLTGKQRQVVYEYVNDLREYESTAEQDEVATDAEQAVLADCARARENRLALLILVATGTILLVMTQLTRSRRTDEPEPEPVSPAQADV
jgi:hypothetical protein